MTTQQHRTQSGVISDFVVVAEDQKFRFSRLTTVRIVLPEDNLCCALLVPRRHISLSLLALFFESVEVQHPDDASFTCMKTLVLEGTGQSVLPAPVFPRKSIFTKLDLHGLVFFDTTTLKMFLTEQVRSLSLIDCTIMVRITTVLPLTDLDNNYMHQDIQNLHRYNISLRWSNIFTVVASSTVRHFTFGSTRVINGKKTIVEGFDPDTHHGYKAYDSGSIVACPFELATFETRFRDALALLEIWRADGGGQKAVEMVQDHELCPRFLQVAGPRLVQKMRQSDFYT